MAYLEKPKGYWYWFKQSVRMCFPMSKDFYGLGDVLWEAASKLAYTLLRCVVRCLLLITSPLSVPVIALIAVKANKMTMEYRAKRLSEERDGFPPEFPKEEVQKVLDGEKTFAQIIKEKESKY